MENRHGKELGEDEEMLVNLFEESTKKLSNRVKNEKSVGEFNQLDSEFMLNHPKADDKKFGNIKIGTFNEWARLSLLEHDSQITYRNKNIPNIRKVVDNLRLSLKKTDIKYDEKSKIKSHLDESLKTMKFMMQKNALLLLGIKDGTEKLVNLGRMKPSKSVVISPFLFIIGSL
jgi:hypothetical protein